jgi:hypothetical protein
MRVMLVLILTAAAACSHPTPPAATPEQLLFVTLPKARSVAVFAAGATGDSKPLGKIRESAPDTPIDASLDIRGEVYVGNSNGTINIYAGRNFDYQRVRQLAGPHTQLIHPVAMAVNPLGNIYVLDRGARPGAAKVIWFSAGGDGNINPAKTLSGPHTGITSPTGIAIDASEEVFVVDHDSGKILIFAADAHGDAPPVATIDGLNGPRRLFIDQYLNIYVTCDGDNSVVVLEPNGPLRWTRTATIISAAMRYPKGVAVDSTGRIAVAVRGAVLYFATKANGSSTPIVDLQGPKPMAPDALMIR